MQMRPLSGSERAPLEGARPVGAADPHERLEVSLILRPPATTDLRSRVERIVAGDRSVRHLTREEFATSYGAGPEDLAAVRQFAASFGLAVVQEHGPRRTVVLSGTVAQFNKAFGVQLAHYQHDNGTYRGHPGTVHLPDTLRERVIGVLGLDNRPQARPHFRVRRPKPNAEQASSFSAPQLAALYDFPGGTGQGECIAIIELGGGFRTVDLAQYFAKLGMHVPTVSAVSVDHGRNHPTGDPNGPDGEVMLDIEVAGAAAPQAQFAVYFAPNTDAGFIDAVTSAIHDTTNRPSVISISWGGPESGWTQQAMAAFDQAFQEAVALGVTICVASGDNGSSDGVGDGQDHVDFPASSPHVLACGGTSLHARNGQIATETVWNDGASGGAGGGGVSAVFALPNWQSGLPVASARGTAPLTMRGVPDVAGDADPQTGYDVRVDGYDAVIGGTSAVAPLWAALIARLNSVSAAKMGFINTQLYANRNLLNDVTVGNNGDFLATPGWDACTGLGTPNGSRLASALTGARTRS
jgi:kumamolisin